MLDDFQLYPRGRFSRSRRRKRERCWASRAYCSRETAIYVPHTALELPLQYCTWKYVSSSVVHGTGGGSNARPCQGAEEKRGRTSVGRAARTPVPEAWLILLLERNSYTRLKRETTTYLPRVFRITSSPLPPALSYILTTIKLIIRLGAKNSWIQIKMLIHLLEKGILEKSVWYWE